MRLFRSLPSRRPGVAALALASLAILAACGHDAPAGAIAAPVPPPVATRLPSLRISTTGGAAIASKDVYVPGTFTLTDTLGAVRQQGPLDVKGHGNSTWTLFPKKPYHLKLGTSAAMLSMPANKHWILLANYSDKTLLRNAMAFDLSARMGFAYTPRYEDVDVYVNGDYQGIYELAEHIRLAPERVNVPAMKASDTSAVDVTGGYLLEWDELRGEAFCFAPAHAPTTPICVKDPETLLEPAWAKQRAYLTSYMARLDSVLYSPEFADPQTGYAAYLDVSSVVDWYILNELFKNVDGNLRRSGYMYKPRGGKLAFGPVWDYDLGAGNVNYLGADLTYGWYVRSAPWFARLFEDPAFEARVKTRWRELRTNGTLDAPTTFAATHSTFLQVVQAQNFSRWPILTTWVWPNRVVAGSYFAEVRETQNWLRARLDWMDSQLLR